EVVLGGENSLYRGEIVCGDLNFLSIPGLTPGEKLECTVKIRYQHAGQTAVIEAMENGLARIVFSEPVRAATPGQSAVFYDNDECVIGGGVISGIK
ncbi:MAG: tRNA 2-thiouridine(34) synthase MnmA, partial [Clostridia bacterium]|nr:tRNA 2-thiouridine(34) synthase MnmA [Clostridia bacterium]